MVLDPIEEVVIPDLVAILAAVDERESGVPVVIKGDTRAPFRSVRRVLASIVAAGGDTVLFQTSGAGAEALVRGLLLSNRQAGPDEQPEPGPPFTLHLRADAAFVSREPQNGVVVWRDAGVLDLLALRLLLVQEAASGARFVVINADDDVSYGDVMAVFDESRALGFSRTLLAGGPPGVTAAEPRPTAPLVESRLEIPRTVHVGASGDVTIVDGRARREVVPHAEILAFEERCEGDSCSLVLQTRSGRRIAVGLRPRVDGARFVIGRPVYRYEGVPARRQPTRTGTLRALAEGAP
ncbi:MAG: hypothetical protein Q8P18_14960 [Pseudomonadota bacterium]|nr:hypothetical protein [Pseudomonadota bacterium]